MKAARVPAGELSAADIARWSDIQAREHTLDSPYFRPEFTAAVAATRPGVEVAILEHDHHIVGFLPYERGALGIGRPVGTFLSDFHGVIAPANVAIDIKQIVQDCGLNAWEFDHLPAAQAAFSSFARVHSRSPFIDLRDGYAAFVEAASQRGSRLINKLTKLARKAERELGPLRVDMDSRDRAIAHTILAWKSAQYQSTGVADVFAAKGDAVALLDRVLDTQKPDFTGTVSALYAGDTLIAGHLGMRSNSVWHYWFPAYDPAHHEYSPGALLLLRMIEHAASAGIARIDLGKGEAGYKSRFMNGATPLLEGVVEVESLVTAYRQASRRAYHWVRMTAPARALRRFRYGPS